MLCVIQNNTCQVTWPSAIQGIYTCNQEAANQKVQLDKFSVLLFLVLSFVKQLPINHCYSHADPSRVHYLIILGQWLVIFCNSKKTVKHVISLLQPSLNLNKLPLFTMSYFPSFHPDGIILSRSLISCTTDSTNLSSWPCSHPIPEEIVILSILAK